LVALYTHAWLAEILTEQGRLAEAGQELSAIGISGTADPPGPTFFPLVALAGLALARSDHEGALLAAFRAKSVCRRYDIRNPAVAGWRSVAALALHALDRRLEARELAAEDLALSRSWGAPRT